MVHPLFVSAFGSLGGAELTLLRLVSRLPDPRAARAVVLTPGPLVARLEELGVPTLVDDIPGRRALLHFEAAARRFATQLQSGGLGVVHANGIKAAMFSTFLARRLRLPLLWHKHDHTLDGAPARALAHRCDRVVCVSRAMAMQFRGRLAPRVSVIHPGVELADSPSVRATDPVVLAPARMDPAKGLVDLIAATALLRARGVPATLRIVGGDYWAAPGHRVELGNMVERLGIVDAVELLDFADDMPALYAGARVVAIASRQPRRGRPAEAAPLVLLEGMSHGRPVVAPSEAGIAELVGDAGRLVENRRAEGFAAALEPYLADRDAAARDGALGRARVEREFTLDRMAARFADVYASVAA